MANHLGVQAQKHGDLYSLMHRRRLLWLKEPRAGGRYIEGQIRGTEMEDG